MASKKKKVPPKEQKTEIPSKRYLTDERVKEVALGFINNKYFCSDQLNNLNLLHMVFMPVMFMDSKLLEEWKRDKVVHLYAPMSSAVGGRSINGYPFFGEVSPMTEADYAAVRGMEKELRNAMKGVLDGKVGEGKNAAKEDNKGLQQTPPSK